MRRMFTRESPFPQRRMFTQKDWINKWNKRETAACHRVWRNEPECEILCLTTNEAGLSLLYAPGDPERVGYQAWHAQGSHPALWSGYSHASHSPTPYVKHKKNLLEPCNYTHLVSSEMVELASSIVLPRASDTPADKEFAAFFKKHGLPWLYELYPKYKEALQRAVSAERIQEHLDLVRSLEPHSSKP